MAVMCLDVGVVCAGSLTHSDLFIYHHLRRVRGLALESCFLGLVGHIRWGRTAAAHADGAGAKRVCP